MSQRQLLLGSLLPIVAYTAVELAFGTLWGLIAGMALGVFEIIYERRILGRVETVTWVTNGMILVLGVVSLATSDGIWFKLQPAILEAGMAAILLGSVALGKPLLQAMMEKQGGSRVRPELKPFLDGALRGLTWRLSLFLLLHAALTTWVALHGSTAAWAMLKGVGFTVSFIVYLLVETLVLRYRISNL